MDADGNDTGGTMLTKHRWHALPRTQQIQAMLAVIMLAAIASAVLYCLVQLVHAFSDLLRL